MSTIDSALVFKSLGDPTRLGIILSLVAGEQCACHLLEQFDISQPTLSYHMKRLTDSGLVRARKEGKWSYYAIDCQALGALKGFITQLHCTPDAGSCNCPE